ncbi:TetR family transcriptional regulator C-terminal domain-containing protein [Micromonospora olivasterospora]|uniref:TetR family transcriptional regulator n=1 Tax=Micromonospora olivasterospora TaxID=1880 RepID=A0A562IBX4_MICOL|nr:TetR family transcriptional regulator C-terminal domain-containing protein [Micromonospora olivasterospora]TWH68213.1 TetR family transcriptional regulator [Micromonospora olivasterospora]
MRPPHGGVPGRVGLAFLAYAAVRPDVTAQLRGDTARLVRYVADLVRAGQGAATGRSRVDPEAAAAGLLATMEGLGIYLLNGHLTPEQALAALDAQLSLIFERHP